MMRNKWNFLKNDAEQISGNKRLTFTSYTLMLMPASMTAETDIGDSVQSTKQH